ncbi:hypothetical protein GCM10009789_45870 [Kribbella sancticallisti]|uniref:Uncharacterized protein n=1 Tax=Kribbella sancticallisti TaxID=460087 RepID=A0ABP4PP68_9ACTN
MDGVPVLSVGSHRHAQQGACFMEYASYLAGEKWSDHPSCTHSLLAYLAREVNDRTSDAGRAALAPLIPTVIGVTSDDPIVHPRLVARVVRTVLPVVADQDKIVLAVALIRAEQVSADLEDRRRLITYIRSSAPSSISAAAHAAAHSPHTDPDELLRRMLIAGIDTVTGHAPSAPKRVQAPILS